MPSERSNGNVLKAISPSGWIRTAAIALGVGAAAGLVVGGVGSRVVMRLIAIAEGPELVGTRTLNGGTIGTFTFSGTVNVLVKGGLITGAIGGLVYLAVRRALPWEGWQRGVGFGVFLLLVPGALLMGDHDFALVDRPLLAMALFAPLYLVYGLVVPPLVERWAPPAPLASRQRLRAVRWAFVVFLLAGVTLQIMNVYQFGTGRVGV